jgi:hypothetical protein
MITFSRRIILRAEVPAPGPDNLKERQDVRSRAFYGRRDGIEIIPTRNCASHFLDLAGFA